MEFSRPFVYLLWKVINQSYNDYNLLQENGPHLTSINIPDTLIFSNNEVKDWFLYSHVRIMNIPIIPSRSKTLF